MTTRAEIATRLPTLLAARRSEAAAMVGISAAYFDRLVAAGVLPPGRALGDVLVWSVDDLRACINSLPSCEFDDGEAIEL
jgi:predicted DNA-binding transcriptional regulator AlpA